MVIKEFQVCPLLDWRYSDVWRTIRGLSIPYCPLYDQGYTSLGDCTKTMPNPALAIKGREDGPEARKKKYLPAYKLQDEHLERSSRHDLSTMGGPTVE